MKNLKPTIETVQLMRNGDNRIFAKGRKAVSAIYDLQKAISPDWLLACAQSLYANKQPLDAIERLTNEIKDLTKSVVAFKADYDAIEKTEKLRLAPLVSRAFKEVIESQQRIDALVGLKKSSMIGVDTRRQDFEKLGIAKSEIDRLVLPFDIEGCDAEIAALREKIAVLELFARTRDTSVLPACFLEQQ